MEWHMFPEDMPKKNGSYFCTLSTDTNVYINDSYESVEKRWVERLIWDNTYKTFYREDGTVIYPRPANIPELIAWSTSDSVIFIEEGLTILDKKTLNVQNKDHVEYLKRD